MNYQAPLAPMPTGIQGPLQPWQDLGAQSTTLLIKNLPMELGEHEKKEFLFHFGATSVRCLSNQGKMKGYVFTSFNDQQTAANAFTRLTQAAFFGRTLKVEYARHTVPSAQGEETHSSEGGGASTSTPAKMTLEEEPLAPQFGLNYPRPPNLHYLYPPASPEIVANISSALLAVPKLYTQVLHLMNKMNLPPPFGPALTPVSAVPPPEQPGLEIDTSKRKKDDLLSSDESELDSEEEGRPKDRSTFKPMPKRVKFEAGRPGSESRALPETLEGKGQARPPEARPQHQKVKQIEVLESKVPPPEGRLSEIKPSQIPQASSKVPPVPEEAPEPFGAHATPLVKRITLEEVVSRRLSKEEILTIPAFKNYQQGEPNENVYIKNLAKQTEISDLQDLFALYFDSVEEMDRDLDIKLMKEGRLKGQSWVNFHSVEKATRAVNEINGYVLHEKPMIVQFGRGEKAKPVPEEPNS